jgi:hypothetical protein
MAVPTIKLSEVCTRLAITYRVEYIHSWPDLPGWYTLRLSENVWADGLKIPQGVRYSQRDEVIAQVCYELSGRYLQTKNLIGLTKKTLDLREESPFNHSDIKVVP